MIEVKERAESRERQLTLMEGNQWVDTTGGKSRYYQEVDTLKYLVTGTKDEEAARKAVQRAMPDTFHGMRWTDTQLTPRGCNGTWEVEVKYSGIVRERDGKAVERKEPEKETQMEQGYCLASFDTTGATEEKFVSEKTNDKCGSHMDWDFKKCINVDEEGIVKGCTITIPRLTFTIQKTVPIVTKDTINALAKLTGCTNKSPFFTFKKNEVLFMGGTTQEQKDGTWLLTLNFEVDPEREIKVDYIREDGEEHFYTLTKKGWEYVWFKYEKLSYDAGKDGSGPMFSVSQPAQAYSEQVYPEAEFVLP